MDLSALDIEVFLQKQGIDYRTDGKNVGPSCVGVCCPYCGDISYHLGIFRDRKNWSCWRCGEKGTLYRLMHDLTGIRWGDFETVAQSPFMFTGNVVDAVKAKLKTVTFNIKPAPYKCELPPSIRINHDLVATTPVLNSFLQRRPSLSLGRLQMWHCRYCAAGRYAQRIIIPVLDPRTEELVSFQARDVTDRSETGRYLTPPGSNLNDYLFGDPSPYNASEFEECSFSLFVAEGPFDVMAIGYRSFATFGTNISAAQKRRIVELTKKEECDLAFVWDGDAYFKALKVARDLLPLLNCRVKVVQLPNGEDPASLGWFSLDNIEKETKWLV